MGEHLVNIGELIVNGIVFDPKNGERLPEMKPLFIELSKHMLETDIAESRQRFNGGE